MANHLGIKRLLLVLTLVLLGCCWLIPAAGAAETAGLGLLNVTNPPPVLTVPNPVENWRVRSVTGTTNAFKDVAWGYNRYVAAGPNGTVYTSPTGEVWTKQNSGISYGIHGLIYDGSLFVGAGGLCNIWSSGDGSTWTKNTLDGNSSLNGLCKGTGLTWNGQTPGPLYVAVGNASSQGNYTIITSGQATAGWVATYVGWGVDLKAVTYGKGNFVAVGSLGNIMTSGNGQAWTGATSGTTAGLNGVTYAYDPANGVDLFVAVGNSGAIYTSSNGTSWSYRQSVTGWDSRVTNNLRDVAYAGGYFVAVGDGGALLTSTDGKNWLQRDSKTIGDLNGVIGANPGFVAVGIDYDAMQPLVIQSDPLAAGSAPTVTTDPAESVTTSSAVLKGRISNTGTAAAADIRGFAYRQQGAGSWIEAGNQSGSFGTGDYSYSLSGLTSATVYEYIARAHSSYGWGEGAVRTFTTGAAGPPSVGITLDRNSAPVGENIMVTMTASNIVNPEYQLWIQSATDGSWSTPGPYSTTATLAVSKLVPGTYNLTAYAKTVGSAYGTAVASSPVAISFTKSHAVTALDVTGPNGAQPVGGAAVFTATATDEGGTPLYQFWYHDVSGWHQVGPYATDNRLTVSNLQRGSYVIAVYALDADDVAAGRWSAAFYRVFILNVGSSVTLIEPWYEPNIYEGVDVSATAVGLTGAEYQFWYRTPGGQWHQSGDYTAANSYFFWADEVGTYRVIVFAKDHYAPATDQFSVSDAKDIYVTDQVIFYSARTEGPAVPSPAPLANAGDGPGPGVVATLSSGA